jgi:ketosteroid isomerase-like protein
MSKDEEEAVIAANRAFYRAFADGDMAAMDALWARERPVACIHPGGPVLDGRAVIMDSWASILLGPDRPTVRPQKVRVFVLGDTAFITCYERVTDGLLAATNVYARERGSWKMVLRQSGPASTPTRESEEARPLVLH